MAMCETEEALLLEEENEIEAVFGQFVRLKNEDDEVNMRFTLFLRKFKQEETNLSKSADSNKFKTLLVKPVRVT